MIARRGLVEVAVLLGVTLADALVVGSLLDAAPARASQQLAALLVEHGICALAAGVLLAPAAPSFMQPAAPQVGLFVAVTTFFVPVLGPLGALAMLRMGFMENRPPEKEPWLTLAGRRGAPRASEAGASTAKIRATLRTRTPESAPRRFEALLATRQLSARAAVPLLQLAQGDPLEEIRLYAFSRLEGMRRALEQQIEEITVALRAAKPSERARLHLRLAECYWELGYEGLAEGAVLDHALQSAYRHAATACELMPGHAPAEFFRGRILVHLRDAARARVAFERAMASGYPRAKVLPYLAECAFHERELGAVAALLHELELTAPGTVFFRPVIELWRASAPEAHASRPVGDAS